MIGMLQNFFKSLFRSSPDFKIHSDYTSPNFNARKGGDEGEYEDGSPSMIILHYTGMQSAKAAIDRLCDPVTQVSAHYVVCEDGRIHQLVDDTKRAWHAGVSHWGQESDINSASIGVEIVNPGHEFGYCEFPQAQIDAVEHLCAALTEKYDIPASRVLGHSDIALGRKIDPGEKFPWRKLATAGIGLYPQPQEMDYQAAEDLILKASNIKELLVNFGYNPDVDLPTLITEFHRHYYPEKFGSGENSSEPDIASVARLLSLIRQKHEL
jgi:N-acetylmuramoyl-L-alanine amidase